MERRAPDETMHQDQRDHFGRRRGSPRTSGAGLIDGPVAPNGCKAIATKTGGMTSAVALNGTTVQFMVNGYINCGSKGRSTQESRTSAVTDAEAAGREDGGEAPVGISVHGVSGPDAHAMAHNSELVTPEQRLPSAMKTKRRRKKFKHKKTDTEVTCPEKCECLLLPPQKEENWENEIQDVSFRVETYGPEDVLQFELQDLTLQQRDTCDLPATARYSPAAHHPQPVHWVRQRIPTKPDQFADAEE